jgi:cytochrome b6-f complex iron-sulfur subunit
MNRKDFIKTGSIALMSSIVVPAILQSCSGSRYALSTLSGAKLLSIKKSEFEISNKKGTKKKQYVLVKTAEMNFPICVFFMSNDLYSAVLMECSHNGCELLATADFLVCPCHGSEFSKKGIVQNPPAENNLKTFIVTSDNENLYIHL